MAVSTSLQGSGTARAVRAITPSGTADLPDGTCRGIYVGTAGNLDFYDGSNTLVSTFPVVAGYHDIQVRRVLTTSTATGLWALY